MVWVIASYVCIIWNLRSFFFYFSSGMQILFRLEKKLSGIEMNILFPYTVYETCFFFGRGQWFARRRYRWPGIEFWFWLMLMLFKIGYRFDRRRDVASPPPSSWIAVVSSTRRGSWWRAAVAISIGLRRQNAFLERFNSTIGILGIQCGI